MSNEIDLAKCFVVEHDFPRPIWNQIDRWVENRLDFFDEPDLWTEVARRWIDQLGEALTDHYQVDESDHFLLLSVHPFSRARQLLQLAEDARQTLLRLLPGIASYSGRGKSVLLLMPDEDAYYRYVAPFYSEGEFGSSGGVCLRDQYPHVVLWGTNRLDLMSTVAHELTHLALVHRTLPQWIEEGMAQMFEHDMADRRLLEIDTAQAAKHKRHWGRVGLSDFWQGGSFSSAGEAQGLSYQLAEILLRHLIFDCRPRWFGFDRRGAKRLIGFLTDARAEDGGAAAARQHLGYSLSQLAAVFLGPGSWGPHDSRERNERWPA